MPPHRRRRLLRTAAALVSAAFGCTPPAPRTPSAMAGELLAADRAFSDSSAADFVAGVARMFAPEVRLLAPGGWVRGREAALESLRANPAHVGARASWTPIRAGISADATHGFTAGYQTLERPDTVRHARYVAYWIRGADGWRVVAYKRVLTPPPPANPAVLEPSLPQRLEAADPSRDALAAYEQSLRAAEVAFSDDAGRRGIGDAFRDFGAPDAVNVGGLQDTTFRRGPEEIARGVERGTQGMALTWGPDEVLVAPSGDLGVSMGYITVAVQGSPARRVPFLTVWRRTNLAAPWRYVAE